MPIAGAKIDLFNDFQQFDSSKNDVAGADVDEDQLSSVKNDLSVSSNETAATAAADYDETLDDDKRDNNDEKDHFS